MFCGQCGNQMPEGARFCSACGAPLAADAAQTTAGSQGGQGGWAGGNRYAAAPPLTRLTRPRANRAIAGVCAGLAQHYGWDLTWVRVVTVLITVFSSGAGLIAYVVFWIVMPDEMYALPQAVTIAEPPPPPPAY